MLVKDVGLVINMEARGDSGPSLMFETSSLNGGLISELATSSARPVTNSLMYEIYRIMPNDTDFSTFKQAGVPGFNFAFIDHATSYHAATDTVQNLNPASLQDQGESVLALTRHFSDLDVLDSRTPDRIYFNIIGRTIIHYSKRCALILTFIAALWSIALAVRALHSREARLVRIMAALMYVVVSILVAYGISWLTITLLDLIGLRQLAAHYVAGRYETALVILILSFCWWCYGWFRRRMTWWDIYLANTVLWNLFALLAMWFLPGASYWFLWPLICCLCVATLLLTPATRSNRLILRLAVGLSVAATLVVVSPTIRLIFIGMGLTMTRFIVVDIVLIATAIVPQLEQFGLDNKGRLGALLAITGAVVMGWAIAGTTNTEITPTLDNLFYVEVPRDQKAIWASVDKRPDAWTAQFLSQKPETVNLQTFWPDMDDTYLSYPASVAVLPPPELLLVKDSVTTDGRTVRLMIRSARGAPVVHLRLDPHEAEITAVGAENSITALNGLENARVPIFELEYYNPPDQGFYVTIHSTSSAIIHGKIADDSYGLPQLIAGQSKRPPLIIPLPTSLADTIRVIVGFSV
jgi:hypothetical protein